jgi:hypothetical protein
VTVLRERLAEQAAAERATGVAFLEYGGANQRVWNLTSKGSCFVDLLRHRVVRALARHVLEGDDALSSHTADIAGPGGPRMVLHSDQRYAPRSIDLALTVKVMWPLVDLTEANGATPLVPGSHRWWAEPPRHGAVATVAGTGPAGTALVFDGRVRHGTGANTTGPSGPASGPDGSGATGGELRYGSLTYFSRPWRRPQENHTLSTHPDVLAGADEKLLELLGFRVRRTLGGVQGPWGVGSPGVTGFRTDGFITRSDDSVGELR